MRIGLGAALAVSIPFAVIFMILLYALIKSLRQKVSTGVAGMIGLIGVADTEIHHSGRVKVRGEYWSACSDAPIVAGKAVRVLSVNDLNLKVEEFKG
jgi:membrane-bound serine protease (ClpP class)